MKGLDERDVSRLLEGLAACIGQNAEWWYEHLQAGRDREEALASWLEFAQTSASPDTAVEALSQFVRLVDEGALAWSSLPGELPTTLLAAARAVAHTAERARRCGC